MRITAALLFALAFLFPSLTLHAGGGPDTFGYIWLDNNDMGGPSVSWIDTNSTWTRVNGLQDDNSVGPFNIGWNFHYYWTSYNTLKVGSNGWLSSTTSAMSPIASPPSPRPAAPETTSSPR